MIAWGAPVFDSRAGRAGRPASGKGNARRGSPSIRCTGAFHDPSPGAPSLPARRCGAPIAPGPGCGEWGWLRRHRCPARSPSNRGVRADSLSDGTGAEGAAPVRDSIAGPVGRARWAGLVGRTRWAGPVGRARWAGPVGRGARLRERGTHAGVPRRSDATVRSTIPRRAPHPSRPDVCRRSRPSVAPVSRSFATLRMTRDQPILRYAQDDSRSADPSLRSG